MSRWLISVASIVIIGCSSDNKDEMYGSGYIVVSEQTWSKNYTTPYPFTLPEGEIGCASNPAFGREVYFHPNGYTDESYIGTPLNKAAVHGLKLSRLTSNVPYSVKEGADLNEAVQIGLKVCYEQEDKLANY
ncbi:hypothetical protein [Psychrobacter sp. FME5]|uniref:hypothetical protein n=1 Tax=Psychrobacter sp. FME5 TaxID=2487706 RepID=UPI0017878B75|nr:hypothetical protein [Psychrobacter sp. FME5]MBE0445105.1 hypothetical protein [Psychrobacter sp. FME5]